MQGHRAASPHRLLGHLGRSVTRSPRASTERSNPLKATEAPSQFTAGSQNTASKGTEEPHCHCLLLHVSPPSERKPDACGGRRHSTCTSGGLAGREAAPWETPTQMSEGSRQVWGARLQGASPRFQFVEDTGSWELRSRGQTAQCRIQRLYPSVYTGGHPAGVSTGRPWSACHAHVSEDSGMKAEVQGPRRPFWLPTAVPASKGTMTLCHTHRACHTDVSWGLHTPTWGTGQNLCEAKRTFA